MAGSIGPDGRVYYTGEGFDASQYGGAPYDPTAPLGSAASVPMVDRAPPDAGMSATPIADGGVNMSVNPGPAPQASAPVQIEPVSVSGSARDSGYAPGADPEQNPIAFMQQGRRPQTPEEYRIADESGYVWQEGRAAQAYRPAGYVAQQRSGAYDSGEQEDLLANASIDQQLANQTAEDAAHEQNRAAIEGARREQAVIERMQLEQARKNAAMREQVDADQMEWQRQKAAYEKDAGDGDSILGTPQGALQTIFGMLAIGLAARGSRENLDSTISAVNGNIDRLVQQQRANVKAKGDMADNAYSRYLRAYGNEEQAQAATRALMLDKAAKQVELTGLRARDPAIAAQSQQAVADIRQRLAEQLAIIKRESEGNVIERYDLGQEARAATGGRYVAQTAEQQDKRNARIQDVSGKVLGNQGKAIDNAKAMTEAQGGGREDLKDFAAQLKEKRANLEMVAKAERALDALKNTKEGENFGGLDDSSFTPVTARATGALERSVSDKAAREMNEIDGIIDAKATAAFGAYNPEQRESIAGRILGDGSKKGLIANLEREAEEARQRIRELDASMPAGTQAKQEGRRSDTGASSATVRQPGRAL